MLKRASWDKRWLAASGSDIRIWKERCDAVRGVQLQMLDMQSQGGRQITGPRSSYVPHVPRPRADADQTFLPLDM